MLWKTLVNTLYDLQRAWLFGDDFPSRLRLSSDFILYRVLKVIDLDKSVRERTIRCSNGILLTYRLNRGDIQSIREVWLDKAYRLPFAFKPRLVVDLGANIGLTSIWYCQQYGATKIVAVEPNPSNAALIRQNFTNNRINGIVIQAAIGATDGTVTFFSSKESNLGRVVSIEEQVNNNREQVKMISMTTLLANFELDDDLDLVKIDIEGGEQQLLAENLSWLTRTKAMIVEFHPDRIDYPGLIKIIEQQGFRYIPANTVHINNMDAFLCEALAVNM